MRIGSPLRRAVVVVALVVVAAGVSAGPAAAARPVPKCDTYFTMIDTWNNLANQALDNGDLKAAQTYSTLAKQAYSWYAQSGCS